MTFDEIKKALRECRSPGKCDDCPLKDNPDCITLLKWDALNAIEELEERIAIMQESMEALEKRCNTLNALEQRYGHWVNRGKDLEAHSMEVFDAWSCSRCRYYIHGNGYPKWKYCPMCGCRMKEADQ